MNQIVLQNYWFANKSESIYEISTVSKGVAESTERASVNETETVTKGETEGERKVSMDGRTVGITFPKLFVYYDLEQVASERQFLMGKSRDSAAQEQQLKVKLYHSRTPQHPHISPSKTTSPQSWSRPGKQKWNILVLQEAQNTVEFYP